jgi:predicted AAA+ superfamily ATPase
MKRDVYAHLLKWKHSKDRKPLIIKGARQVGKTYIVKQFAKNEYKNIAYINFEQDPNLINIFEENLKPDRIMEEISIYLEKKILPPVTLIFFDEVQECPKALTSLKYFAEEGEKFHVIAAGSLLGIKFSQKFSFPVGKVDLLDMFPMTFMEFLSGMGYELLEKHLVSKNNFNSIENLFHEKLKYYLKLYFLIGGMPEAINKFKDSGDIKKVRKYQQSLLKTFEFDFSKHTSKQDAIRITNVWNAIPKVLAKENKKFTYSEISKHSRARDYYGAIRWLLDSGLIYQSYRIKVLKLPAKAYLDNNIFKLYFLDVGLLGALLGLSVGQAKILRKLILLFLLKILFFH